MKFFSIAVGEKFYLNESRSPRDSNIKPVLCTKVSAVSYTISSEHVLGEHSIDPQVDLRILTVAELEAQKAEVAPAAKNTPAKAAKDKTPAKKAPKKTIKAAKNVSTKSAKKATKKATKKSSKTKPVSAKRK